MNITNVNKLVENTMRNTLKDGNRDHAQPVMAQAIMITMEVHHVKAASLRGQVRKDINQMKNQAERRQLLLKRALESLDSEDFRHQLIHHTDMEIHSIERINGSLWITLVDGTDYHLGFTLSEGKRPL